MMVSVQYPSVNRIPFHSSPKHRAKKTTTRYVPRFDGSRIDRVCLTYEELLEPSKDKMADSPEIFVRNLTFSHSPAAPPSLSDVNITLPKGSRTLLIGANGGVHSSDK
jgi:ABC-type multidrug transport system fused ATPase/permease subunit